MFDQLRFYISHSLNDLQINKRLTFFALLSVAAGVAAIVSLQTLAVMIANTLEVNLQANNRGDISASLQISNAADDTNIQAALDAGLLNEHVISFLGQSESDYTLSQTGIAALQTWLDDSPYAGRATFTYRNYTTDFLSAFTGSGTGTAITALESGNQASQLQALIIDKEVYPYYSEIRTTDGRTLADALQQPTDLVLAEDTAQLLDVGVGDAVGINGSSASFNITGLVNIEAEVKGFEDFFAGIFGFYYLDFAALNSFEDLQIETQTLYFQLDDPTQANAFADALLAQFPYLDTTTLDTLREDNEELTTQIDTFVAVMGLISLLLGSIGIINTMQVIVRRRMLEVAVLKTLGLQAQQITILFLTEALLVGLLGSVVGVLLGWFATIALRGVVSGIFGSQIAFIFAPSPAINGFVVGVVVATVFGFLPTLTAGKVRPGIVLRPSQGVIPRAGRLQSLLALLIIIVSVSAIVAGIIDSNAVLAFAFVAIAFLLAGLLYLLLVFIIWLIGRFLPAFGLVDLKISLRQMLAARNRGASTLLALVVGVFSLSTITLFAESISNILEVALEDTGGNVIIAIPAFNQLDNVRELVESVPGVNSTTTTLSYSAQLQRFTDSQTAESYDANTLEQRLYESDFNFPPFFDGTEAQRQEIQSAILESTLLSTTIEARDDFDENTNTQFLSGRDITPADSERPVIVLPDSEIFSVLGVDAGDTITYNIVTNTLLGERTEEVTFQVIGIAAPGINVSFSGTGAYAPAAAFPESSIPSGISLLVDVDEEAVPALRRELAAIPGIFALETAIFTRLINSLLAAFTAFPTLVASLGLIVGGVVIANSVALATMERRHEIAVMKAVGLQRERVLGMLLLENSLLGFIGGLIGVGFGLMSLVGIAGSSGAPISTIPFNTAFLLMLLCVGVAVVAAITSAWDASGEKPLTVLRYE